VLLLAVLPVPSASANVASDISIGFAGTAYLSRFPCAPPPSPSCAGSLSGGWAGHAAGEWHSGAFDVSWENLGGLGASFTYWEASCVDPTSAAAGSAYGGGSAVAGPGQIRGNWQGYGELPRDVIAAYLTFTFDWIRLGTEALISFRSIGLDLDIAGFGRQNVANYAPPTMATFVPTPSTTTTSVPTCQQPVAINGQTAGTVEMAVRPPLS
jgi:hypothetical protein